MRLIYIAVVISSLVSSRQHSVALFLFLFLPEIYQDLAENFYLDFSTIRCIQRTAGMFNLSTSQRVSV